MGEASGSGETAQAPWGLSEITHYFSPERAGPGVDLCAARRLIQQLLANVHTFKAETTEERWYQSVTQIAVNIPAKVFVVVEHNQLAWSAEDLQYYHGQFSPDFMPDIATLDQAARKHLRQHHMYHATSDRLANLILAETSHPITRQLTQNLNPNAKYL